MIVFYSWQSDLPATRKFAQHCLNAAIKQLNEESNLIEADRGELDRATEVKLDHDTKDVLGIPDIAATILEKIGRCNVS